MSTTRTKDVDNMKGRDYLRRFLVEMVLYCHENHLNNAQIGVIFHRDRSVIKRIIDKHKPKRKK